MQKIFFHVTEKKKHPVYNSIFTCSYVSHTDAEIFFPYFLESSYWKRHSLNFCDVHYLFEISPAHYIWILALIHGVKINKYVMNSKKNIWENISAIARSDVISKLMQKCSEKYVLGEKNVSGPDVFRKEVIDTQENIPACPIYTIQKEEFIKNARNIVEYIHINTVLDLDFVLNMFQLHWVPIRMDKNGIMCQLIKQYVKPVPEKQPNQCENPKKHHKFEPFMVFMYREKTWKLMQETIIIRSNV